MKSQTTISTRHDENVSKRNPSVQYKQESKTMVTNKQNNPCQFPPFSIFIFVPVHHKKPFDDSMETRKLSG